MTETPASPYWLSQPAADATGVETILFLPGGPGDRGSADNNFVAFFARHPEFVQSRRVATMYSTEGPMTSVWPRAHDVAAELVACFGVPAGTVHLMGHSNGGAAVWSVIQNDPSPYKTLLAAPGSWGGLPSDATLRDIFGTRPVYLGVGANDGGSRPGVQSVYDKLLSLDLEVTLDVWAGEGHVPGPDFDPAELYAFIDAH